MHQQAYIIESAFEPCAKKRGGGGREEDREGRRAGKHFLLLSARRTTPTWLPPPPVPPPHSAADNPPSALVSVESDVGVEGVLSRRSIGLYCGVGVYARRYSSPFHAPSRKWRPGHINLTLSVIIQRLDCRSGGFLRRYGPGTLQFCGLECRESKVCGRSEREAIAARRPRPPSAGR